MRVVVPGGKPGCLIGREGKLWHHMQFALADGLADGIRRRVLRDSELLVPEFGLVLANLVMQAIGLIVQLEPLLTKVENGDRQDH